MQDASARAKAIEVVMVAGGFAVVSVLISSLLKDLDQEYQDEFEPADADPAGSKGTRDGGREESPTRPTPVEPAQGPTNGNGSGKPNPRYAWPPQRPSCNPID